MPHINYRRGDTRHRSKCVDRRWRTNLGFWNRLANRAHRAAETRVISGLRRVGYDIDVCEDTLFPLQEEADNYWNYD